LAARPPPWHGHEVATVVPNEPTEAAAATPARGVGRGAALVTLGILGSKVVGLARNKVVAHYLGTSDLADATAAAFRVGNITQNLLGEGTLSATFIPVYAKLRLESREKAARFARATLGLLLPVVVFASVLFTLAAPLLSGIIASGFEGDRLALTIKVTRVVFPMTGVLVAGAWSLGVLNAHRRFFLPYIAPVIWSLAQIVALVGASMVLGLKGTGLAMALGWGALAGAVLQVAVMMPSARRVLGGIRPTFSPRTEGVKEAAARLPGAVLGRGVIQLSGLIDTMLVSHLGSGANAVLGYAQNIYLLPMSILGAGEAAAALPEMAEQGAGATGEERKRRMRDALGASLSRLVALSAVATAVFAALGDELVTLLLQGGRFDRSSTHDVEIVLAAYAFGLPGNAICRLLTTVSYALGDTNRPAVYAVIRVVVSTAVGVSLMGSLGVSGVVLGAVAAAWVELALLGYSIRAELGGIGMNQVPLFRIAIVCAATVGVGLGARYALPESLRHHIPGALVVLGLAGAAFLGTAHALKVATLRSMLRG
jgi:putative peptidoglycan lipid II flippase